MKLWHRFQSGRISFTRKWTHIHTQKPNRIRSFSLSNACTPRFTCRFRTDVLCTYTQSMCAFELCVEMNNRCENTFSREENPKVFVRMFRATNTQSTSTLNEATTNVYVHSTDDVRGWKICVCVRVWVWEWWHTQTLHKIAYLFPHRHTGTIFTMYCSLLLQTFLTSNIQYGELFFCSCSQVSVWQLWQPIDTEDWMNWNSLLRPTHGIFRDFTVLSNQVLSFGVCVLFIVQYGYRWHLPLEFFFGPNSLWQLNK